MASGKTNQPTAEEPALRSSRRTIKSKFSSKEWVTDDIVPKKEVVASPVRPKKMAKVEKPEITSEQPASPPKLPPPSPPKQSSQHKLTVSMGAATIQIEEPEDLPEAEVVTGEPDDSQDGTNSQGEQEEELDENGDEVLEEKDGEGKRKRYSNRLKEASFATLTQWREGIKCPHCSYVGHSATRLEQHFARVHEEDQVYRCREGDCEFECKWNREFYKHMKGHFGPPPYKCEYCEYVCDRIQFILSHRMRHTDERPYACELCNFSSRTKGNLIVHMRIHTGEKPYQCKHCERSFAMKNTLDQHLATHRDDRPFLCDTCGFSTKYQSHLLSHKRIHTGNVFHCQQPDCTYFSPRRSQLAAHMRSHLSIRSHICATCGRGFIEKSHLIRHERIHLEEKPFKCDDCEYGSTRRDKLKEHRLKHHPSGDAPPPKPPIKAKKSRTGRPLASLSASRAAELEQDTNGASIIIEGSENQISEQEIATANLVYEYTGEDGNLSNCVVIQTVDGQDGGNCSFQIVTKTEENGDDEDGSNEGQQIVMYTTTESVD